MRDRVEDARELAEAAWHRLRTAPSVRPSRLVGLALTVGILVAWLLLLRPDFLGGPASYVLVSGESMEPTLSGGDLVVARKADPYRKGDIIAYRVPKGDPAAGGRIIHRIVGGSAESGFLVQGDNRGGADLWRPRPGDVIGKLWFSVPQGGRVLAILRAPLPLASLAAGLALVLVLTRRKQPSEADEAALPVQTGRLDRVWLTSVWRGWGHRLRRSRPEPRSWLAGTPRARRRADAGLPAWVTKVPPVARGWTRATPVA